MQYTEALGKGAVSVFEGVIAKEKVLPNQDISAYFPPAALLEYSPKHQALSQRAIRPNRYDRRRGPRGRIRRRDEYIQWLPGLVACLRRCRHREKVPSRTSCVLQGGHQYDALARRSRGSVRRHRPILERLFRRRPLPGPLRHPGAPGEKLYGNFPDHTQLPDEVTAKAAAQKAAAK